MLARTAESRTAIVPKSLTYADMRIWCKTTVSSCQLFAAPRKRAADIDEIEQDWSLWSVLGRNTERRTHSTQYTAEPQVPFGERGMAGHEEVSLGRRQIGWTGRRGRSSRRWRRSSCRRRDKRQALLCSSWLVVSCEGERGREETVR